MTTDAQSQKTEPRDPFNMKTIGVMGLGYVGLPLLMAVAENGFVGLGFDILQKRVDQLNSGKSYLKTFKDHTVATHVETGRFSATTDMDRLAECDAILICVPTPLNQYREPDLSYVVSSVKEIVPRLQPGQLVVLESTTYPGTTDELIKPLLEESGLVCGQDFFLAYSPEREDPGNINFSTSTIPKVIGGIDDRSTLIAAGMYQRFITQTVSVSSARTAEAIKLTENIFRAVNIGLVNELKIIFDAMDIDTWEVIDGAKTKPFGFMPFYPGPGWGGHCIPIDPFYLTWKAREFGKASQFIENAGIINDHMPDYVVERAALALDTESARGLRGAKVLVLGVAYKKDVDDARESPALQVINRLNARNADVSYHDPFIPVLHEHGMKDKMESVSISDGALSEFDVVLICTDHTQLDWERIVAESTIVVDTRNATKNVINNRERIYKA